METINIIGSIEIKESKINEISNKILQIIKQSLNENEISFEVIAHILKNTEEITKSKKIEL